MSKKLKYRDLPWELKRLIDASGPMMMPRKSENPTAQHILKRLKDAEEDALLCNAPVTAKQKRDVIDAIENYINEDNQEVPKAPEPQI